MTPRDAEEMGLPRVRKDVIARRLTFSTPEPEFSGKLLHLGRKETKSRRPSPVMAATFFCIFVEISSARAIKMADGLIGER